MNLLEEISDVVKSCETDYYKFFHKGNKTAGIRLRKKMQEIRHLAKTVRNEIQETNLKNSES